MSIIFLRLFLLLIMATVIRSQNIGPMPNWKQAIGCHLTLNNGWDEMEPMGDPLALHVRIRVLHLRDVPDSGGSFGVDLM